MQKASPSDILTSKSCVNNIFNCNEFKYNLDDMLNFKGDIGEERKRLEYLSNIKDCELKHCCEKSSEDTYHLLSEDLKKKYYKINVQSNKIVSYNEYINLSQNEKLKYRCPTSYDICKYGIDKQLSDCPKSMCRNIASYKHPFKSYNYDLELVTLQNKLIEILKADDIVLFEKNLPKGYNINQPLLVTYPGNTLLFDSIMYGANNCSFYIMKENPNLSIQNKNGNTALNIACLKGNIVIIKQLLLMGADMTIRNNLGENALMCAIRSGNDMCVMEILNNGSSVHIKNKKEENPLFIAVTTPNKNLNIIRMLIEMGCIILEKNSDNKSMLKILNEKYKDTDIGRQIGTLLINTVIKIKGNNYYKILNEMPEFSILEFEHTPKLLNKGDITVTVPNAYTVSPDDMYNKNKFPKKVKATVIEHFGNTNIDSSNDYSSNDYSIMEFVLGVLIILMGLAFTFYLIRK